MNVNEKLWNEFLKTIPQDIREENINDIVVSIFEEALLEQEASVEIAGFLDAVISAVTSIPSGDPGHSPDAKVLSQTRKSAVVTETGSRKNRTAILQALKDSNFQFPGYTIGYEKGTATDGSAIYKILLQRDSKVLYTILLKQGQAGKGTSPNSTKFEENLANALNAKHCPAAAKLEGAGSQFDSLAEEIVSKLNTSSFGDSCFKKLPKSDVTLSALYQEHGVTNTEPKTDLVSTDGKIRISVKKDTAQFISAQGNETAAVFTAVMQKLDYGSPETATKMANIIKKYFRSDAGISNLKSLNDEEKVKARQLRQFLMNRISNFGGGALNHLIIREALLGEAKFETQEAIPNYFLVWSENDGGKLYTADQFVRIASSKSKLGVRGRGGTRGLSLRGDT
jgi:hypothetical protein